MMDKKNSVSYNKKNENVVDVKLQITRGEFMALMRVLRTSANQGDALATDIHGYLNWAASRSGVVTA
jgi:hypothetical protein